MHDTKRSFVAVPASQDDTTGVRGITGSAVTGGCDPPLRYICATHARDNSPLLHKEGKGFAQPKAFSSEEKVARFAEPDEVDTPKSGTLFADQ